MRAAATLALGLLAPAAWAGEGFDSNTTVGVDSVYSPSVIGFNANVLLAERLRWSPHTAGPVDLQVVADARFRLDAIEAPTLERAYVPRVGVELTGPHWSARIGRHPVSWGSALLFDGAEILWRPGTDWAVGAWGGASPDQYTSRPEARFGGGPIISWTRSALHASLVGEALFAAGGLDRASVLALGSVDGPPGTGVTGRLDVQVADPNGKIGVADAFLAGRVHPTPGLDADAFYEAYSSVRYLRTEDRDPSLSRFADRSEAALGADVPQDTMDGATYQLGGAGLHWLLPKDGPGPRASLVARYRWAEDPSRRLLRISPSAGLARLVGDRLTVDVDGTALYLDDQWRGDAGVRATLEPLPDRSLMLDGSAHVLVDSTAFSAKPGWATDLYVDWVGRGGWVLSGGFEWVHEPWGDAFRDVGYRGFLTASKRFSLRPDDRSGSGPSVPPSPGIP